MHILQVFNSSYLGFEMLQSQHGSAVLHIYVDFKVFWEVLSGSQS